MGTGRSEPSISIPFTSGSHILLQWFPSLYLFICFYLLIFFLQNIMQCCKIFSQFSFVIRSYCFTSTSSTLVLHDYMGSQWSIGSEIPPVSSVITLHIYPLTITERCTLVLLHVYQPNFFSSLIANQRACFMLQKPHFYLQMQFNSFVVMLLTGGGTGQRNLHYMIG